MTATTLSQGTAAPATDLPLVICLMGPTAAGKTDLAVAISQQLPCDIVSVDSAMVYRGMDIGTAKPDAAILAQAPHRLIDIRDPAQTYSAADFCADARREVAAIHANGRIPLLVGGTGLYFRAFEQGLALLPAASHSVRQKILSDARTLGWDALHQRLQAIDPDSARRIHPHDPQRLQRALEVYAVTGKPMSQLLASQAATGIRARLLKYIVAPADRAWLRERIRQRFTEMLAAGLVEEVRGLYQRGDLHADLPALRMVGYRQVWQFLADQLEYEDMITHAVVATRQLAKRQLTWFRAERDGIWFDSRQEQILSRLMEHLLAALRLS
ncbi:MAG: tRNA (adenosine(37)-N6)-dimethylallyltransferase MiaA [Gammaproteobacteria bacterium]